MSHPHAHGNDVPRPVLAMALALVGVSLLMTTAVRFGLAEREAVPSIERARAGVGAAASRSLTFADREDGAVVIADARTGKDVAVLIGEADSAGFVRGVLRGLARDRQMRGIGAAPPFTLTQWQNGSLTLTDSATGRAVELGAFGPDNRDAFARLMKGRQS